MSPGKPKELRGQNLRKERPGWMIPPNNNMQIRSWVPVNLRSDFLLDTFGIKVHRCLFTQRTGQCANLTNTGKQTRAAAISRSHLAQFLLAIFVRRNLAKLSDPLTLSTAWLWSIKCQRVCKWCGARNLATMRLNVSYMTWSVRQYLLF